MKTLYIFIFCFFLAFSIGMSRNSWLQFSTNSQPDSTIQKTEPDSTIQRIEHDSTVINEDDSLGYFDFSEADSNYIFDKQFSKFWQKKHSFPQFSTFPGDAENFSNFRYNRVDGFFIGLGTGKRLSIKEDPTIMTHFGLGYGFGSHYWQVFGGLDKRFMEPENAIIIGLEAHKITSTHDSWKISGDENTAHAFFAREDYRDYFLRSGWGIHFEKYFRTHFRAIIEYHQDLLESSPRNVSWSLFGGNKTFQENPFFDNARINSVILALNYDNIRTKRNNRSGFHAAFQAEFGSRDWNFSRYLAEAAWFQPLGVFSLNTRMRLGSLVNNSPATIITRTDSTGKIEITGTLNQNLPAPFYFALGGVGTLPGFSFNEFSGNRMFLWNSELIFHVSPLKFRHRGDFNVILFTDIGSAKFADAEASATTILIPSDISQMKFNYGVALGSENDAFRIGASWRTDRAEKAHIVVRFTHPF